MAEKISVKDKKVQESLKANVGKYIEVRGVFVSGDPINKLEGEALERDIRFQKETQHRMYIQKDPYIKFKLIKYALSRGYAYDDVASVVDKVLAESEEKNYLVP